MHIALTEVSATPLVYTVRVLDWTYCTMEETSPTWVEVYAGLQVVLAAVMCLLVAIKFIRDSFQMYKVTKQWQPGCYMELFAREGMLYFLAYVRISTFYRGPHSSPIYCGAASSFLHFSTC